MDEIRSDSDIAYHRDIHSEGLRLSIGSLHFGTLRPSFTPALPPIHRGVGIFWSKYQLHYVHDIGLWYAAEGRAWESTGNFTWSRVVGSIHREVVICKFFGL